MKDIENQEDIKTLVDAFYSKVKSDDKIGVFFNDIAKVNWDLHLPKMYSFWNSVLFGAAEYKGKPILQHLPVNDQMDMARSHFDRWISLWTETVSELFSGPIAERAVRKANNMANLMSFKMDTARQWKEQ